MTLQIIDNSWELKLNTELDTSVPRHSLGSFNSSFIIVNISSDSVDPRWRQAGYIGQGVIFDDKIAYGEFKEISLDNYLLLEFPLLSTDNYELFYLPLPRLVQANIRIWEYKGSTKDTELIKLLEALKSFEFPTIQDALNQVNLLNFSRLESKLDKLLTCCDCNDESSPNKSNRLYLLYYHKLL